MLSINILLVIVTGGMEELTLEQIKKKSELEEEIDFESGDFFPSFKQDQRKIKSNIFYYFTS